ncbi:MAG: hypothetical protein IJY69_03205 [Clostridia bacterium]|nr:hypothetical protein [Clostridia bacterium]
MKSIILLSTKAAMYLTEIPIIFLMWAAIYFNSGAEGLLKLYPLIIACGAIIIFIFIYLLRAVVIGYEEVRSFGPFSSKDRAVISKGKILSLTLKRRRKIKVELFGYDDAPMLDWAKDQGARYANLYRDVAVGGMSAVRRVLSFFGFDKEQICSIIESEEQVVKIHGIIAKKSVSNGEAVYSLEFTETL